MATIIFYCNIKEDQWARGHTYTFVALAAITYFLGAILGSSICSSLVIKWTKKKLKHIPLILYYLAGALFIGLPNDGPSVMVARTLAGMAMGFSILTLIIHAGEVATPKLRGLAVSVHQVAFALGILFGTVIMLLDSVPREFPVNRVIGIIIVLYTALAQLLLYFYTIESPIFHLQNNNLEAAVKCLMRLRNDSMESWDIRITVDDHKSMLSEDRELNTSIFSEGNSKPLALITCTAVLSVLSFNYPLNVIRIRTMDAIIDSDESYFYGAMALAGIKVLAVLLSIGFTDFLGRRRLLIFSW